MILDLTFCGKKTTFDGNILTSNTWLMFLNLDF